MNATRCLVAADAVAKYAVLRKGKSVEENKHIIERYLFRLAQKRESASRPFARVDEAV